MKRMTILLAVLAAGALATVGAAGAHVIGNETFTYAYAGWVPCAKGGAGELATGTIEARVLETSTTGGPTEASGFLITTRGSLVGAASGDTYRLVGATRGTAVSAGDDHSTLTYVNRYRLVGQGTASNLVVRETAHVTWVGDDAIVQFDAYVVECA